MKYGIEEYKPSTGETKILTIDAKHLIYDTRKEAVDKALELNKQSNEHFQYNVVEILDDRHYQM